MSKINFLQRFIFENAPIRGEFVRLTESYQTIISQHNYPPEIKKILGEALCIACLLGAIIKSDGKLTVQFRGEGDIKLLLVQCTNKLQLRGLVKWEGDLNKADVLSALQKGVLSIILDAELKNLYQGIVPWRGQSLAEAIENYFHDSEQLSTKIRLATDKKSATGMLLQIIPPAEKNIVYRDQRTELSDWMRILTLTNQLDSHTFLSNDCQVLLQSLFPNDDIRIFSAKPVTFKCTCTRKRGENAILMLGKDEALAELKNKNAITVTCEFCNQEYLFDNVDIAKLFADQDDTFNRLH